MRAFAELENDVSYFIIKNNKKAFWVHVQQKSRYMVPVPGCTVLVCTKYVKNRDFPQNLQLTLQKLLSQQKWMLRRAITPHPHIYCSSNTHPGWRNLLPK
jgi:hypothetical protein